MTQIYLNNFGLGWQNKAAHALMKAQALFVCKDVSTDSLGEITCRDLNQENGYFTTLSFGTTVLNIYHVDVEGADKRLRFYTSGSDMFRWNSLTGITSSISTAMTGAHVSYAAMQPVLSSSTHVFATDGTTMLADDGTTTKTWGIDPPTGSPRLALGTLSGSLSAGDYKYRYTFYDANTGSESDPSPETSALTVGGSGSVTVSNIEVSGASRVTSRRIYRTIAGGGTYYLVATVPDNSTTEYTDLVADSALSTVATTDQGIPPTGDIVIAHDERLFLSGNPDYPQRLYFSRKNRPDNWPSTYYVETGSADDKILNVVRFAGKLYAIKGAGIEALLGSDESNYALYNTRSHIGTVARWSVAVGPDGIYFAGGDGIYRFNGLESSRVSDPIGRIFRKTATSLTEIVNMGTVGSVARGRFMNGVYYAVLPMRDSGGTVENKLLTYDTLEKTGKEVGTWLLHNLPLDDIFTDGGRNRVYGSKETSSGSGSYMVYNLMEYASSSVDTPSPEIVTKEVDVVEPSSFSLSGKGLSAQRKDSTTEILKKYRVDAVGDWTLTFYLDGREVYEIALTDLSAEDRTEWRMFEDELRGAHLYVKIVGTNSPRPDSHIFRALEIR